ncbi:amidase domain-containing protein [Brevibacillus migulae]|uniref:amidase domain-containing protein n=1 Tax=Brevibacillus migulae TaxID=1644114 RepID=UPI001F2EFF02|nr:amidase domain-containing protein [Brevibacillus migulae]
MGKAWTETLKSYLEELNQTHVDGEYQRLTRFFKEEGSRQKEAERWQREREQLQSRGAIPHTVKTIAKPLYTVTFGAGDQAQEVEAAVALHQQFAYRLGNETYLQENQRIQKIRMRREGDDWAFLWPWGWYFEQHHLQDLPPIPPAKPEEPQIEEIVSRPVRGSYDRARAVAYAERYWNSYNPAYIRFENDCTSFISQCLHAGGIPMIRTNNRSQGWWYRGGAKPSWSYSWAVANSLYLLLRSGKAPMHAVQRAHPSQLQIGDVICYDFDGDGRWQHNTMVVAKDSQGMPLVNAHTTNSRMRYWAYMDSTAYTQKIRYAFFHIRGS